MAGERQVSMLRLELEVLPSASLPSPLPSTSSLALSRLFLCPAWADTICRLTVCSPTRQAVKAEAERIATLNKRLQADASALSGVNANLMTAKSAAERELKNALSKLEMLNIGEVRLQLSHCARGLLGITFSWDGDVGRDGSCSEGGAGGGLLWCYGGSSSPRRRYLFVLST